MYNSQNMNILELNCDMNNATENDINIRDDTVNKTNERFEFTCATASLVKKQGELCDFIAPENAEISAFKTASGNKINIPSDAVEKVNKIFFQTALSSNDVDIASNAEEIHDETSDLNALREANIPLFKTASGSKINVSSNALNKANALINSMTCNDEDVEASSKAENKMVGFLVSEKVETSFVETAIGAEVTIFDSATEVSNLTSSALQGLEKGGPQNAHYKSFVMRSSPDLGNLLTSHVGESKEIDSIMKLSHTNANNETEEPTASSNTEEEMKNKDIGEYTFSQNNSKNADAKLHECTTMGITHKQAYYSKDREEHHGINKSGDHCYNNRNLTFSRPLNISTPSTSKFIPPGLIRCYKPEKNEPCSIKMTVSHPVNISTPTSKFYPARFIRCCKPERNEPCSSYSRDTTECTFPQNNSGNANANLHECTTMGITDIQALYSKDRKEQHGLNKSGDHCYEKCNLTVSHPVSVSTPTSRFMPPGFIRCYEPERNKPCLARPSEFYSKPLHKRVRRQLLSSKVPTVKCEETVNMENKNYNFTNKVSHPNISNISKIFMEMQKIHNISVTQEQLKKKKLCSSDKCIISPNLYGGESYVGKKKKIVSEKLRLKSLVKAINIIPNKGVSKFTFGKLWQLKRLHTFGIQLSVRQVFHKRNPGIFTSDELRAFHVCECVQQVTSKSAGEFVFPPSYFECSRNSVSTCCGDNFLTVNKDGAVGLDEFFGAFLSMPGLNSELISKEWFKNHYRFVVLKLASYERSFPCEMGGNCLTPETVLDQIRLRYDREIYVNERSALKKIFERDESPSKTMVLFVSDIIEPFSSPASSSVKLNEVRIKLSDGWYEVYASIDVSMKAIIERGRLKVGQKIITSAAQLVGADIACSPLQANDSVALKIHTNSTRIARWDVKLGFYKQSTPFPVSLSSVLLNGGQIGCVDVVIQRNLGVLYLERCNGNKSCIRNARMEAKMADTYMQRKQECIFNIIENTKNTFAAKKSLESEVLDLRHGSRSVINDQLEQFLQSECHTSKLTNEEQMKQFQDYKRKQKEKLEKELKEQIDSAISEARNKGLLPSERAVTPFLKLIVEDMPVFKNSETKVAELEIWHVNDETKSMFEEGTTMRLYYLTPVLSRSQRDGFLLLKATKISKFKNIVVDDWKRALVSIPRQVVPACLIRSSYHKAGIIDVVGMLIHQCELPSHGHMYIFADVNLDIMMINFSPLLAEFPTYKGVMDVGNVVAAWNLASHNIKKVKFPTLRATLHSKFSTNPQQKYLQDAIKEFMETVVDKPSFMDAAKSRIHQELSGSPPPHPSPSVRV